MANTDWVLEKIFKLLEHNQEDQIPSLQTDAEDEYMKLTRKLKQIDRSKLTFLDTLLKCTYNKDWKSAKWNLDGARSQYNRFILPFWQNEKDYQRYLEAEKQAKRQNDHIKDSTTKGDKNKYRIPYQTGSRNATTNDVQSEYNGTQRINNGKDPRRIQSERDTDRQNSYLERQRRTVPPREIQERIQFSSYERNSPTPDEPKKKETHEKSNDKTKVTEVEERALKNMDERKEITRRFTELYDKEYSLSLSDMQEMGISEQKATACLLHIVQEAYSLCKDEAESQMKQIDTALFTIVAEGVLKLLENTSYHKGDKHLLLQYRKDIASMSIKRLQQEFNKEKLWSVLYDTNVTLKKDGHIETFTNKCVSLLWWMVVQDPPMYVYTGRDSRFNLEFFKEHSTTGSVVDFYRWPAVLSHRGGKVLAKGTADCY